MDWIKLLQSYFSDKIHLYQECIVKQQIVRAYLKIKLLYLTLTVG